MKELQAHQSISEKDIDLLVLEELSVSTQFANWFVSRVVELPITVVTKGAWHSVQSTTLGESDLVYLYQAQDLSEQAILIENKIDAIPQPEQGLRYRYRGEEGIENGHWVDFRTCLIAPKAYLLKNTEPYDNQISYEEILSYFSSFGDSRSLYRAKIIKEAIEKNRRGYQSKVSPEMTVFAEKYIDYVKQQYPELQPEQAKPRAAGHSWIHFYPDKSNKRIRLIHQVYGGSVKLQFQGQVDNYDEIVKDFSVLESSGFIVSKSGKSVNVEIDVPKVNPQHQAFEEVVQQTNEAINQCLILLKRIKRLDTYTQVTSKY